MTIGRIQSNCATDEAVHTGIGNCDVNPGLITGVLITAPDFTFPTTDAAAFTAAIKAGILSGRVSPVNGIELDSPSGGEVQNSTSPYGTNTPTGFAPITHPYRIMRGGTCLGKELAKLNTKQRRFVWFDINGMTWGEAISDTEGRGFFATAMVTPTFASSPTEGYRDTLQAGYDSGFAPAWVNRFAIAVSGEAFSGLIGAVLEQTAVAGEMRIVNPCSGEDVGIAFATEWAPEAFADSTGAAPTSATMDENTGILTIAPTTGSFRILGAAVLDGLDIVGLDGLNTFVSAAAKS